MEVSIIIPYNLDRGYLAKAVETARHQTIPVNVIKAHSPGTCAQNLADGLEKVTTPYYCVLAEDDWLSPDFCERMLAAIKRAKCAAVCSNGIQEGDVPYVYESKPPVSLKMLLSKNTIHGGTVIYNTELVRAVGGYDRTLITAEELDLHYKLLAAGMCIAHEPYAGYHYRRHNEQKSRVKGDRLNARIECVKKMRSRYESMVH